MLSKSYDRTESTDIDKLSAKTNGYGTMTPKIVSDEVKRTGFNVASDDEQKDNPKEAPKGCYGTAVLILLS